MNKSIAVDRLGFGQTIPNQAVPSQKAQAEALSPLLVEREGKFPILVGHSLGGPIVARIAAEYQDRVGGLVIIAGNLDPKLEELRWYNYLARPFEWLLPKSLENSNKELWDQKKELEELAPLLKQIKIPVVIIHGTDDRLVPFDNVEFMVNAFQANPNVKVLSLKRQGHFVIWENEDVVRKSIQEFIQSSSRM